MTAALYVRVSTLNQVERESLKNQEERLIAHCKANNLAQYKVYKDAGVSAKDIKRPALEQLLDDIKQKKVNTVIVTKLDRITRSLRDLIELMEFFEETNVKFISITQNIDTTGPMGRFMLNLLGSVAQVEREMTAERVSEDMLHRALSGKWNGGPIPYGYTIRARVIQQLKNNKITDDSAIKEAIKKTPESKKLYIDEKEAETVKLIYDFYQKEKSLRGVTTRLNAEGYKTRNNSTWAVASVLRVLTNPTYTGRIWYGKRKTNSKGEIEPVSKESWKIVQGEHERIIDDNTFYRVQDLLGEKSFKKTRAERTYLLSGLAKCGHCKGPMYGYTYNRKYKNKTTGKEEITSYFWYRCHNYSSKGSSVCSGMVSRGKELDDAVIQAVAELSKDKTFLNNKKRMLKILDEKVKPESSTEKELKKLVSEERTLSERKQTLLEKLEAQVIDDLTFKSEFDRLKGLLEANQNLQTKLRDFARNSELNKTLINNSYVQLTNFSNRWEILSLEEKRARLLAILKEVIVEDGKITIKVILDAPEEIFPELKALMPVEKVPGRGARKHSVPLQFRGGNGVLLEKCPAGSSQRNTRANKKSYCLCGYKAYKPYEMGQP